MVRSGLPNVTSGAVSTAMAAATSPFDDASARADSESPNPMLTNCWTEPRVSTVASASSSESRVRSTVTGSGDGSSSRKSIGELGRRDGVGDEIREAARGTELHLRVGSVHRLLEQKRQRHNRRQLATLCLVGRLERRRELFVRSARSLK